MRGHNCCLPVGYFRDGPKHAVLNGVGVHTNSTVLDAAPSGLRHGAHRRRHAYGRVAARTLSVVLITTAIIAPLLPTLAGAQDTAAAPAPKRIGGAVGKILDGIGRLAGTPAERQARARANGTSAHAQLQVVGTPTFTGGDTALVARLHADTGTVRIASSGTCGASRVCAAGWDLRVVSVTLPASEIGAHSVVPITVEIENRGRTTSPVSEVQLCAGDPGRPCSAKLDLTPLPPLASGARLRIVRHTTSTDATGPLEVQAIIDPDHATGEVNRSNNVVASGSFSVVDPTLEFVGIDAQPESGADGMEGITISVRNPSMYVPTMPTQLEFVGPFDNGGHTNTSLYTMDFPALAPRQILRMTIRVQVGTDTGLTGYIYGRGYLSMFLDPTHQWGRRAIQGDVSFHVPAPRTP